MTYKEALERIKAVLAAVDYENDGAMGLGDALVAIESIVGEVMGEDE